jgi:cell division protease FtsH
MVMRFGMSDKLGPRVFGHEHAQPFLGREFSSEPDYSDDVAREIDAEIRLIVEDAHQSARSVLEDHREQLDYVSEILLRRETIEREEFIKLLDGAAEEDVFGPEEPVRPEPPEPPEPERVPEREKQPRPLPRPGLAGGTAEMRGLDPGDRS